MEKLFQKATPDELKKASSLLTESYSEKNAPVPIQVKDIPVFIPYQSGWKTARFVGSKLHLGQRKLFLNKLQFLAESLPAKDSRAWVVYAGAAPSVPIGLLASLFPKVRFLLVDPNPFYTAAVKPVILNKNNITESAQAFLGEKTNKYIFILNSLFTEELATELQKVAKQYTRDLLFISDIRTNLAGTGPSDLDILWNSAQQTLWLHLLQPKRSMLKFRHPFWTGEIGKNVVDDRKRDGPYEETFKSCKKIGFDFIKEYNEGRFLSPDGDFYIQPWAPLGTTETRLVVDGIKNKSYTKDEVDEYEGRLFYLNLFDRGIKHHKNENADRKICFDHCYDCALENVIWKNYLDKYDVKTDVTELVFKLSSILRRNVCKAEHGALIEPLTLNKILELNSKSIIMFD